MHCTPDGRWSDTLSWSAYNGKTPELRMELLILHCNCFRFRPNINYTERKYPPPPNRFKTVDPSCERRSLIVNPFHKRPRSSLPKDSKSAQAVASTVTPDNMPVTPIIQPVSVPDVATQTSSVKKDSPIKTELLLPSITPQLQTTTSTSNVLDQMDPEVRQWAQAVPTGIVSIRTRMDAQTNPATGTPSDPEGSELNILPKGERETPKEQFSHMPTVGELFSPMSDSASARDSAEDSPPVKIQRKEVTKSDPTDLSVPVSRNEAPAEMGRKKAPTGKKLKVVQREIAEKKGVY